MSWSLASVLEATGGRLVQPGGESFRGVTTDTRRETGGMLFVALHGPRFDGHDFVADAVRGGAAGAIVSRDVEPVAPGIAWIRVDDGLRALGDLAARRRRELAADVVAVTGSNGKTTTREMVASIARSAGKKVAQSRGNENNLVGLPQTILRLDGDEDVVVLEMGMNRPGEILRLTEIARPDLGVLTNVAPAHLEGLGSVENVAAAKGELVLALPPTSILVINARDPHLRRIAKGFAGRTVLAGPDGDVEAVDVAPTATGGQRFTLVAGGERVAAEIAVPGPHNVTNAVVAAAAGLALGFRLDAVTDGLSRFTPPPMRLERRSLPGDVTLLDDSYNANPGSVEAALATLVAERATRRIAVLGEMAELGERSGEWHREIGRMAGRAGVDLLVAVGRFADETSGGARESGLPSTALVSCASTEEAITRLRGVLEAGDVVLLKGSRIARMETIAAALAGRGA